MLKNISNMTKENFPALSHKNFRYFWLGQCVSLIGTWIQNITQGWLVLEIASENQSLLLGIIGALQFTPLMLFSLFSGVIVDRFNKKKLLIFTQSGLMIMAIIQGVLVRFDIMRYWHLMIIAFLVGCLNSIDFPTRHSLVIELVGKKDLMNGIALNSTVFNAARIIGPGVGGILIGYFGIAYCYFINAVSFIPVIYGICKMQGIESRIAEGKLKANILFEIKEGLKYIWKNKTLVKTFGFIVIMGIFAFNYNVLIPIFSTEILGLDSKSYGFLMSSLGIGSLIGAVTMATKKKGKPKEKTLQFVSYAVSILLIIMGIVNTYYSLAFFLALVGIFNVVFSTSANSRVQLNAKDQYRGRVMSVYSMLFAGVTPIGSLFTGTICNNFGPRKAFIFSGILSVILLSCINIFSKNHNDD